MSSASTASISFISAASSASSTAICLSCAFCSIREGARGTGERQECLSCAAHLLLLRNVTEHASELHVGGINTTAQWKLKDSTCAARAQANAAHQR